MLQNLKSIFHRYFFVILGIFIAGWLFAFSITAHRVLNLAPSVLEYNLIILAISFIMLLLLGALQHARTREEHRLTHDSMTSLPYKSQISTTIDKDATAYVFIILKEYYQYLERYGLVIADSFVKVAAQAIQRVFKEHTKALYRFADTDFLLICDYPAEEIQSWFQQVIFDLTDETYQITSGLGDEIPAQFILSVGITPVNYSADVDLLITYANFASRQARNNEGASAVLFDLKEYLQYRAILERRHHLPELIAGAQLETVFMPIISYKTGGLYGYEALTRPTNPAYRNVADALDDAEVLGIYSQLEMLMTLTAIQTFRELEGTTRLFVNMAPETIEKGIYDLPIKEGLFDGIKFVIEIIERGEVLASIIATLNKTIAKLNALIALDDFGTGYSNHLALLNSKPDIIKVPRELIENIEEEVDKQQAYENIVTFARGLGVHVLAEGIETQKQFEFLLRLGMDFAQGYYIGKPAKDLRPIPGDITKIIVDYQEFSALLEQHQLGRN